MPMRPVRPGLMTRRGRVLPLPLLVAAFAGTLAGASTSATLGDGSVPRELRRLGATVGSPSATGRLVVNVGGVAASPPVAPGFVGFSFELPTVLAYAGTNSRAPDPVLVQLIRNVAPGQAPVLRIGGDSTDSSWWPVPGMRAPAGVTYRLTPNWMRVTRALARRLGARLILGVNLAAANRALTVAEARAMVDRVGRSSIAALEIGNEPGYYGHLAWYHTPAGTRVLARPSRYDLRAFTREFSAVARAVPQLPLAGPTDGNLPGVAAVRRFVAAAPRLGLVTLHRYPLIRCVRNPAAAAYPSIAHLLTDSASTGLATAIAPYVRVAHTRGIRFRLDELNSVSCRGATGVSETFASALWALDALFALAQVGVDGVNLHTFPGALYQPFVIRHTARGWSASVRPIYYGMLMFAQAAPAGSRLLSVSTSTVPSARGGLRAWATLAPDRRTRVVLINESLTASRTVHVRLTGVAGPAALARLRAQGASAVSGVTLAGRSFGASTRTGRLAWPAHAATVAGGTGGYSVTLPPASAAMLTSAPRPS